MFLDMTTSENPLTPSSVMVLLMLSLAVCISPNMDWKLPSKTDTPMQRPEEKKLGFYLVVDEF